MSSYQSNDWCELHLLTVLMLSPCSSWQIFSCARMKFSEIPMKLAGLLQHPDPIVINHLIRYIILKWLLNPQPGNALLYI